MNPIVTLIRAALDAASRPSARRISLARWTPAPEPLPVRVPAHVSRVLLRSLTPALALAAVLAVAAPHEAGASISSRTMVDGNVVDVSVLVDGRATTLFQRSAAWDRHYFEAFRGRNYALQIRNTTGQRIGVLIAVDGLNVVNGERSSLRNNESMYVLDPYETTVIRGWRTSLNDVRKFVFVDEERSYAERTGQANGDMGWIRVLAFREDRPAWRLDDWNRVRRENGPRAQNEVQPAPPIEERESRRGDAPAAPQPTTDFRGGAGGAEKSGAIESRDEVRAPLAQESTPGTGWGDQRFDPVREVEFRAERAAVDRITLRYEYTAGLRALGIEPRRSRVWERERGELGFAKPPQW